MLGFRKKEDPNRRAMREEFEAVTAALRKEDKLVQAAVGNSINTASNFFIDKFNRTVDFQNLPKSERISYINKLTELESRLRFEGDVPSSLGFGLFKMWVGAASELDSELMDQFYKELSFFGKQFN